MKRHSAILFPDTVPDEQVLFPLVPVFQPIVYCQPVENGQENGGKYSHLHEEFYRHALYELMFPAPLGADKERFLHLLSDLRHRGDDYAAQLTRLSLASLGSRSGREPETKSSILSNLLDRHGIRQAKHDMKELVLWQARLVLKLGEFFDEDQRLIRQEMEKIRAKERGLISELRKEPEYVSAFVDPFLSVSVGDDSLQALRMKAWARIFALGEASPENCSIFITRNNDAFERLVEEYERISAKSPEEVLRLSLPACFPEPSRLVELLQRFTEDAAGCLERITARLDRKSRDEELPGAWENMVERYFPADSCGRRELNLSVLGGVSARRFFLQSFGHDDDMRLADSYNRETGIVIGVLT